MCNKVTCYSCNKTNSNQYQDSGLCSAYKTHCSPPDANSISNLANITCSKNKPLCDKRVAGHYNNRISCDGAYCLHHDNTWIMGKELEIKDAVLSVLGILFRWDVSD